MPSDPTGAATPTLRARLRRFLAARFDRKSQLGIGLTTSVIVCALAIWALSGLLDAILDNDAIVRWDAIVNNWFHQNATAGGLRFFDVLTQLGSYGVVAVVVIVAFLLWRARAKLLFWLWLGANVGGSIVEYVLKTTVHRSRPQYAAVYLHGHSYSFPSGHTMASTICYLLLAYLLSSYPEVRPTTRRITWIVACGLVASIAFSRLYLGVHYPSDVLGGFAAGLGWLAMCAATRNLLVVREGLLDGGWRTAVREPPPSRTA